MLNVVTINGSPTKPSRTGILIDAVAAAVSGRMDCTRKTISLSEDAHEFMCGLTRPEVTARGEKLLQMTEQADLLILGTPVYRATYTGVFKHFFDLVDRDAMRDRKAVLCATGGTPLHGLMLEHQMRPLMGFFSMQTITTGLFGLTDDFADGRVVSPDLNRRIERVANEVFAAFAPAQALAS